MRSFQTLSELAACVGQEVATSDWTTITQQQVNLFAEATGDRQWIHVDPERATAGPFGGPIAHSAAQLKSQTSLHDRAADRSDHSKIFGSVAIACKRRRNVAMALRDQKARL